MTVEKGQWFRLPSGKTAQVCRIVGGKAPEVVIRYLDNDGAMAAGEFQMTLAFLLTHGKRVKVAAAEPARAV
ncbi:hypothetical protein [Polaromonas sp.]|uniref:hypothetical protein n=1 Tax=Polaromonas sp. TaxID=1869339 RepID=UPI0032669098